ncbi:MAG: TIGR03960 family B12-binding radical SAM protein, partial [Planctomycetia bacterium]
MPMDQQTPRGDELRGDALRRTLERLVFPDVEGPGQYAGGEPNSIVKDRASVETTLCLAFPDTYALGMSCHGVQVLYTLVNDDPRWACERAFCPRPDFEAALREHGLPLYGLESFTPLVDYDVVGFSLQYEVCYTNLLTMLDLGGIPLHGADRTMDHPLVLAGGPGAQSPEILAPFIDVFLVGDGEETLPELLERWSHAQRLDLSREEAIAHVVKDFSNAYAPRFYEPEYFPDGRLAALHRTRPDVPREITAAAVSDFSATPIPTRPIVPLVEVTQERIAVEIMRGCPWQCRFCQATVIKRPL